MRIAKIVKFLAAAFFAATVTYAIKTKQSHGKFVGVPFEFRFPTMHRIKKRMWNRDDPRLFTERPFGVGWTINFHEAGKRIGVVNEDTDSNSQGDLA